MRYANTRITPDAYAQVVNSNKRAAQRKIVKMMDLSQGTKAVIVGTAESRNSLNTQLKKLIVPGFRSHFRSIRSVSHFECMAGTTGLEPATSAVTGQRSNQLSYVPKENLFNQKSDPGSLAFPCPFLRLE